MYLIFYVCSSVMSTIGQIVVDGRIYPSQSSSPASSVPPQSSPSPSQIRPPQQMSPMSPMHQLPSPSGYQPSRIPGPPPYNQFQNSNQYQQGQNMTQTQVGPMGPNMQMGQVNQAMGQNMAQNMGKCSMFVTVYFVGLI